MIPGQNTAAVPRLRPPFYKRMKSIHLKDAAATEKLAEIIASCLEGRLVLGLVGNLGAGKTCLSRGIAKQLGVQEEVCSPTFLMLNEYQSGRIPFFHFDLYRLQEDLDMQSQASLNLKAEFDEIMESSSKLLVAIEWINLWEEFCSQYDELRLEFRLCTDGAGREVEMQARGKVAERVLACCQEKIAKSPL